jgi:hypothetical protein
VLKDRRDEARLRADPITLPLVEEVTVEEMMTSEEGIATATSLDSPVMGSALSKILRAEETGDSVSDL